MSTHKHIKVVIQTNIPGVDDFVLTRENLYHPELGDTKGLTMYPFMTNVRKFKKSVVVRMSRIKQVRLFFDPHIYGNYLNQLDKVKVKTSKEHKDKDMDKKKKEDKFKIKDGDGDGDEDEDEVWEEDEDNEGTFEVLNHNVNVMIEILFPSVYPVILNHANSYDKHIRRKTDLRLSLKGSIPFFKNTFPSLMVPYAYIKEKGKVYTVAGTTILNDIVNHPLYRSFFDNYVEFQVWQKETREGNDQLLKDKKADFKKLLQEKQTELETTVFRHMAQDIATGVFQRGNSKYQDQRSRYLNTLKQLVDFTFTAKGDTITINYAGSSFKLHDVSDEKVVEQIRLFNELASISQRFPSFNWNSDVRLILPIIFDLAHATYVLEEVQKLYFSDFIHTAIDVNDDAARNDNETERREIVKFLREHYQPYIVFVQSLVAFQSSKRRSTNTMLQELLDGMVIRRDMYKVKQLSKLCDRFAKRELKTEKRAHVGVTRLFNDKDNAEYEMYLFMQCIGGELNESNIYSVSCAFKNHTLGAAWNDMQTPLLMEVNKTTGYFTLEDALSESEEKATRRRRGGRKRRTHKKKSV